MDNKTLHTPQMPQTSHSAEAFVLSRDPNKAMQEMMATIDAVRTVYREENDALLKSDTKAFSGLQQRKIEAIEQYKMALPQILARKDEIKKAKPEIKTQLQNAQDDFARLAGDNLKALAQMQKGLERLNKHIMSAVRKAARKEHAGYRADGVLNESQRRMSVGISETA